MSVSLRLTRMGTKKKPFYRIIAIDSRVERDGKYIEQIGIYNPLTGEKKVNSEIALKWLTNGAKPSQTVRDIFSEKGIMKDFHESKQKSKDEKNKLSRSSKKTSKK
ncbi:MAG: 30S ribosomal protein S16 [Candidatus Hepatoplasma vulgare]|nr:MAG: 30S ribosomal protein S16 [Candidatus Hepatoplasma sp.]